MPRTMSNEIGPVERESQTQPQFTGRTVGVNAEPAGRPADISASSSRGVAATLERESEMEELNPVVRGTTPPHAKTGRHWRWLAFASAVLLTILTVAAIYLVARRPSTVDQLVILTVPSGAEIKLDGKDYGHSPVKLERLAIGTYTISITKEGFEPVEKAIPVSESDKIEFRLKPVAPSEALDLPAEEQIKGFQQLAEEAFARGAYGLIYEGSALNWIDLINYQEPNNAFEAEMRERIRKTAHQSAQAAVSRGDLAQGKEIYSFLLDHFPYDEEARVAAARLESQLAARRGKIGELIRKAEESFQSGHLIDPMNASAYYYSKQVLAIDKDNEKARQIRNEIKDRLTSAGEQAANGQNADSGIRQLDQAAQLFPEDKRLRARVRDLQAARALEQERDADPESHRVRGLDQYRKENFADAVRDLEVAVMNGRGTNEVLFALARSHQRLGQLDQAEAYFLKLPPTAGDSYRSAIAARGDMALQRGDSAKAVERWKEARQLGGSTMYTVGILDDKIERVERPMREKAAEPQPLTIEVRHVHGGLLGGSCSGPLTVSSTGVIYEGKEHQYSYNVAGVGVRISKDEMTIQFGKDSQKFKVARTDAERFRESLVRYQNR